MVEDLGAVGDDVHARELVVDLVLLVMVVGAVMMVKDFSPVGFGARAGMVMVDLVVVVVVLRTLVLLAVVPVVVWWWTWS